MPNYHWRTGLQCRCWDAGCGHWCEPAGNSGGTWGRFQRFGMEYVWGIPLPQREGSGTCLTRPQKKMIFFAWYVLCFGVFWAVSFVRAFVGKMLNFPLEVVVWSLLVDVSGGCWQRTLGSSEYAYTYGVSLASRFLNVMTEPPLTAVVSPENTRPVT